MSVKTLIPYSDGIYFITFTCYKWLSIIQKADGYDLVYKWFDSLRRNNHFILGYVIMPNHVHSLIGFRNCGKSLNKIIGAGKRFLAYEMIDRLEMFNSLEMLSLLACKLKPSARKKGKLHEVWKNSFDWKECRANWMIEQKLNYMHENPCAGKWNLAPSPADYPHSSAKFYLSGDQGIYPVTNYLEMADIDLTRKILI